MENPQSYVHKPLDLRQTTKYSIVEVDAIVARCKELEQLLLQQKEELDAARAELLVSREDYESLDFYTRGIKSEREKLKSYSSNLRAENHDLLLHREETNTINGDLQDEIAGQKRALATLGVKSNAAHARIATLQAETTNYGIEKKSMESEIKKMKPFYALGVSVRRRFLEHARIGLEFWKLDDVIIKSGNDAAHRGLGRIDAILFTKKIFSLSECSTFEPVFIKLYNSTPTVYEGLPSTLMDVNDLEATILSTKTFGEGLGDGSIKERMTALGDIEWLRQRYKRSGEQGLVHDDAIKRLDKLRKGVSEIVDLDRKTKPQYRKPEDASPQARSSTNQDSHSKRGGRSGKTSRGRR